MECYLAFFTVDYRDGFAYVGNKRYKAGAFAVNMMNQFYKNDTAARLSVYRLGQWQLKEQLTKGYILVCSSQPEKECDNGPPDAVCGSFPCKGTVRK